MEIILIGIISSWATKFINKINEKLLKTSLEGLGAFILSFAIAIIASIIKVFWVDKTPFTWNTSYEVLAPIFTQIWTTSQVYFMLISKKLNLGKTEKNIIENNNKEIEFD